MLIAKELREGRLRILSQSSRKGKEKDQTPIDDSEDSEKDIPPPN